MELSRIITPEEYKSKPITTKFFVVAKDFAEYQAFLEEADVPERYAIYVSAYHHIAGYGRSPYLHVVYYGTYWDNPIWEDWRGALQLMMHGMEDDQKTLSIPEWKAMIDQWPTLDEIVEVKGVNDRKEETKQ